MHILNGQIGSAPSDPAAPDPAAQIADEILASANSAETAGEGEPPQCAPFPIQHRQWTILGPAERYISENDDVIICLDVVQDELLFAISGCARGWTTLRNDRPLRLNQSGEVDLARQLVKFAREGMEAAREEMASGAADQGAVVFQPPTQQSSAQPPTDLPVSPSPCLPISPDLENAPLNIQPAQPIEHLPRVFRKGDQLGDPFTLYSPDGFAVVCMGLVTDELLYNISGGARGWGTLRIPEPLQINIEQQLELGAQLASAAASHQRSELLAAELQRRPDGIGGRSFRTS